MPRDDGGQHAWCSRRRELFLLRHYSSLVCRPAVRIYSTISGAATRMILFLIRPSSFIVWLHNVCFQRAECRQLNRVTVDDQVQRANGGGVTGRRRVE